MRTGRYAPLLVSLVCATRTINKEQLLLREVVNGSRTLVATLLLKGCMFVRTRTGALRAHTRTRYYVCATRTII